ncbi:hypothetical protein D3C80_1916900 [compost metagenome]
MGPETGSVAMKKAASMVEPLSKCSSGEPLESEPEPFQNTRLMTKRLASRPTGACQVNTLRCSNSKPPNRNARLTHSLPLPPKCPKPG